MARETEPPEYADDGLENDDTTPAYEEDEPIPSDVDEVAPFNTITEDKETMMSKSEAAPTTTTVVHVVQHRSGSATRRAPGARIRARLRRHRGRRRGRRGADPRERPIASGRPRPHQRARRRRTDVERADARGEARAGPSARGRHRGLVRSPRPLEAAARRGRDAAPGLLIPGRGPWRRRSRRGLRALRARRLRERAQRARAGVPPDTASLFLVLPEFHLPAVVVVSPGSHRRVARFMRRLPVPIYTAVVRLGLEQERGENGITYSVIVPEFVAPLDGPSAERFAALHRQLATFAS